MGRSIIHMDMDAFYAAVEQRDDPSLVGKPIIIGGVSDRGVVCTASYEARKYGIHSAMSAREAKKLCPYGIYLPTDMEKYKRVSREVRSILQRYSDRIEPVSIDEAFLDTTGRDPIHIAKRIKGDIRDELRLTASVGVSINKFLAKLASDMEKPDGLTIIREKEAVELLKPLPITKLWGVGPSMEKELNKLGIYYIGDVQGYDRDVLISIFGQKGSEIYDFSYGIDHRPVEERAANQSIGEEETFREDMGDMDFLVERLATYAMNLSRELKSRGYLIRTITVKVKYGDFSMETRSHTLALATNSYEDIFKIGRYILTTRFEFHDRIRLLGLTVSNLIYPEDPVQLSLDI
ncbi:MAG: DNA polymerase IV [Tissierellia bacterium]|nr:DNA polymerase IV [Tissierellia bacterium]